MSFLQYREDVTFIHNKGIIILDSKFKRIFKIRDTNEITENDIEEIIKIFKNSNFNNIHSGINQNNILEKFKRNLKIIKVNYLSKDVFRNFWYV